MATTSSSSTSVIGEVTSVLTQGASLLTSVAPGIGLVDDAIKLGSGVVGLISKETDLHNTPAIQNNVESQRISEEKARIEKQVQKNDLETDQKEAGL